MTELKEEFEKAVAQSKELKIRPDNETLLRLYSLYKQATEGDIEADEKPAMFDFVAQAKYNAWSNLKGTTIQEAMHLYITLVTDLAAQ
jgi:diazepam-binding inhibitor (GABA receptor modulating acyl-CoA-binding protein)